jgi:hypothetical protein
MHFLRPAFFAFTLLQEIVMKKVAWIAVLLGTLAVTACGSMPSSSMQEQQPDQMDRNFQMYGR